MSRATPQRDLAGVALSRHGLITVDEAEQLGVDTVRLRQMARRGAFERISRGVYRLTGAPHSRFTAYVAAALWPRQAGTSVGVISHESALDLHELCDVNPGRIDITVPSSYRLGRRDTPALYRFHRRDLADHERTDHSGVPVVTPVRAILDAIEIGVRDGLIQQAIQTLRRRDELNLRDETRVFAALNERHT